MFYSISPKQFNCGIKENRDAESISATQMHSCCLFFLCEAVSPETISSLSILNSICSYILKKYPYLSFGFLHFPLYGAWEECLNGKALFTTLISIKIANGTGAKKSYDYL